MRASKTPPARSVVLPPHALQRHRAGASQGVSPTGPGLRWAGLPVCHGSGAGLGPRGHSRSEQPELRFTEAWSSLMPALGSSLPTSLRCGSDLRLRKAPWHTRAHSAESETEGSPAFYSRTTVLLLLLTHLEGLQGPAVGGRGLRQEAPLARAWERPTQAPETHGAEQGTEAGAGLAPGTVCVSTRAIPQGWSETDPVLGDTADVTVAFEGCVPLTGTRGMGCSGMPLKLISWETPSAAPSTSAPSAPPKGPRPLSARRHLFVSLRLPISLLLGTP